MALEISKGHVAGDPNGVQQIMQVVPRSGRCGDGDLGGAGGALSL